MARPNKVSAPHPTHTELFQLTGTAKKVSHVTLLPQSASQGGRQHKKKEEGIGKILPAGFEPPIFLQTQRFLLQIAYFFHVPIHEKLEHGRNMRFKDREHALDMLWNMVFEPCSGKVAS